MDGKLFLAGTEQPIYDQPIEDWDVNNAGHVIIERYNKIFFLGGRILVEDYRGATEWAADFNGGVIIQRDNKLLRNDCDLLFHGEFSDWCAHPNGFVVEMDGQVFLNGSKLLYNGPLCNWTHHVHGAIFVEDNQYVLQTSDKEIVLFKGDGVQYYSEHPNGMIIQDDHKLQLIVYKPRSPV